MKEYFFVLDKSIICFYNRCTSYIKCIYQSYLCNVTVILKKSKKNFFSEIFPKKIFHFFSKKLIFSPKKMFSFFLPKIFLPKNALREPNGAGSLFHGGYLFSIMTSIVAVVSGFGVGKYRLMSCRSCCVCYPHARISVLLYLIDHDNYCCCLVWSEGGHGPTPPNGISYCSG